MTDTPAHHCPSWPCPICHPYTIGHPPGTGYVAIDRMIEAFAKSQGLSA